MSKDQDSLNLKETLNLPFTEFPMKAGLAQREPEMLARWQKLDIYQRIADKNIGKIDFTFFNNFFPCILNEYRDGS